MISNVRLLEITGFRRVEDRVGCAGMSNYKVGHKRSAQHRRPRSLVLEHLLWTLLESAS